MFLNEKTSDRLGALGVLGGSNPRRRTKLCEKMARFPTTEKVAE